MTELLLTISLLLPTQRFVKEAANNGVKVDVSQVRVVFDQANDTFGWCDLDARTIHLNKEEWRSMPRIRQEALLFHEFGHCVLKRDHCSVVTSTKIPVSLMHPYLLDVARYRAFRDYYVNELFKPHTFCKGRIQ
jgi:hypothetical protein